MPDHLPPHALRVAALAALTAAALAAPAAAAPPPLGPHAWTIDSAEAAFRQAPDDPFAQYLLLQLAKSTNQMHRAERAFEQADRARARNRGRTNDVDLFSLFSGAVAVQESLQLDTLAPEAVNASAMSFQPEVDVASLAGPGVASHPWGEMLAGRTPEVSALSKLTPADCYFVESRSLIKLLDALESGDLWRQHVTVQTGSPARVPQTVSRVQQRLALRIDPLLRPLYDTVVDRVAITGSDLYIEEGNDVTLLFSLKQPAAFRVQSEGLLAEAAKQPGASSRTIDVEGVTIRHVSTPDRGVHVFAADPRPDLHIRSTSEPAIRAVLKVVRTREGALGETEEYRYLRTLMPQDAAEEDFFVYLSDPFVRRILSARVKLTERRRLVALTHLRMIEYGAVLYRTQYGRPAASLAELLDGKCLPLGFRDGSIRSPFGGTYSLGSDGLTGMCSVVGTAAAPRPCLELELPRCSKQEAEEYRTFVTRYESYWRTFFDPIAIRVQATPEQYRAETIVLPLINNSLYQSLLQSIGGDVVDVETLPVASSTIGSVLLHINKAEQQRAVSNIFNVAAAQMITGVPRIPDVEKLIQHGLGDSLSLHVCDSDPLFDLNLLQSSMVLLQLGSRNPADSIGLSMLLASLTAPVYVALPVTSPQIVDEFLADLDAQLGLLARQRNTSNFIDIHGDYYVVSPDEEGGPEVRVLALRLGPATFRFYWARIEDGLYIATRRSVLDELLVAAKTPAARPEPGANPPAHARLRIRPEHWRNILPTYLLGWAEGARNSTLQNLGTLGLFLPAQLAVAGEPASPEETLQATIDLAQRIHGVAFLLPDGGAYALSEDGRRIVHSDYGDVLRPRQKAAPTEGSPLDRAIREFQGLTADLTFLEDGLHAVVTIRRTAP
ncbi:MAG: hypothetical protein KF774_15270 [Planctomyces sp.]|nr:hypothetical protein [Planctomyces sp.]